jgi:aminoglycoside/choline kinase family phosphotransferase
MRVKLNCKFIEKGAAMESTEELKAEKINVSDKKLARKNRLLNWLATTCGLTSFSLQTMPGDASFRYYFRVVTPTETFVVMDAEREQASCLYYVAIAKALRELGVLAPDIIKADLEQGFLLMTDLGELTYLKALTIENADLLYRHALLTLALLQSCRHVANITVPAFSADFMLQEWAWFKEWFLIKLLKLSLPAAERELDQCYQLLIESALEQPQVFMHRDYHAANLMVLPDNKVGVLDFQDAFIGPVTYDAVSLLRDCYIDWPNEQVRAWAINYSAMLTNFNVLPPIESQVFLRWFDWMGMQRHLKALITFSRKHIRDGQSHYLHFVPRTLKYLTNVSQQYPEFAVLHDYLRVTVQPVYEKIAMSIIGNKEKK